MVEEKSVVVSSERVKGKEFISIVDKDTGEIIDQYWHNRSNSPNRGYTGRKPEFYKVYRTNWQDIIMKKRLTLNEVGFLMSVMAFAGWESNFLVHPKTGVNLSCRDIAELLHMTAEEVSDYMERLTSKGLIAVVKCGQGYPNHYIINTNVLFRGSKMKDLNEHNRFTQDCPYAAPVEIKYKQRD